MYNKEKTFNNLVKIINNSVCIKRNENMKMHTSFKIGGCADFYISPQTMSQLITAINYLKEQSIPYYILGNGTNMIIKDEKFQGCIISLKKLNYYKIEDDCIFSECGTSMSTIALAAKNNSLTGAEFISGIPGTIGVGININAGAYNGQIQDIFQSALIYDIDKRKIFSIDNKSMNFKYRYSIIEDKKYLVLNTKLKLNQGNINKIEEKMNEFKLKRSKSQPLEYPNAGSIFKKPENNYAGKLIEEAGYKGFIYNGAKVSEKHANFIINYNNATALDILTVMDKIQNKVYDMFNIYLEPEVKIL